MFVFFTLRPVLFWIIRKQHDVAYSLSRLVYFIVYARAGANPQLSRFLLRVCRRHHKVLLVAVYGPLGVGGTAYCISTDNIIINRCQQLLWQAILGPPMCNIRRGEAPSSVMFFNTTRPHLPSPFTRVCTQTSRPGTEREVCPHKHARVILTSSLVASSTRSPQLNEAVNIAVVNNT